MPALSVILPAAGNSTRFGGPQKKPFLSLGGLPIWQRSAELFTNRAEVRQLLIVVPAAEAADFAAAHGEWCRVHRAEIVAGGAERFDSVANALARIPTSCEFVIVHDAVRPLITSDAMARVIAAAVEQGAAMLALPVADTLKRVDPRTNRITETVPRAGLWAAQTPQVFRRDWLVAAYANRGNVPATITDDAQLVEAIGHSVSVVPGSPEFFKITTRADFEFAEIIWNARAESGKP